MTCMRMMGASAPAARTSGGDRWPDALFEGQPAWAVIFATPGLVHVLVPFHDQPAPLGFGLNALALILDADQVNVIANDGLSAVAQGNAPAWVTSIAACFLASSQHRFAMSSHRAWQSGSCNQSGSGRSGDGIVLIALAKPHPV